MGELIDGIPPFVACALSAALWVAYGALLKYQGL